MKNLKHPHSYPLHLGAAQKRTPRTSQCFEETEVTRLLSYSLVVLSQALRIPLTRLHSWTMLQQVWTHAGTHNLYIYMDTCTLVCSYVFFLSQLKNSRNNGSHVNSIARVQTLVSNNKILFAIRKEAVSLEKWFLLRLGEETCAMNLVHLIGSEIKKVF